MYLPKWCLWLDAKTQRGFDAVFQRLMLWGFTKRMIRRNLWCLYLVSFFIYSWYVWIDVSWIAALVLGFSQIPLYGRNMLRDDEFDRQVEDRPWIRSLADTPTSSRVYRGVGWFLVTLYLPEFILRFSLLEPKPFWGRLYCLSMLAQGYLINTPPILPPPKKKKANAELAPSAHLGTY